MGDEKGLQPAGENLERPRLEFQRERAELGGRPPPVGRWRLGVPVLVRKDRRMLLG